MIHPGTKSVPGSSGPLRLFIAPLLFVPFVLFHAGCRTAGEAPQIIRANQADAYQVAITQQTEGILSENGTLTLDKCIEVALANNLEMRAVRLQKQLAKVNTDGAFSYLLPNVELNYNFSTLDHAPAMKSYGDMADRSVTSWAIRAQQPIFVPQAWFMYEMQKRGEDISKLAVDRTAQGIRLQITADYFACWMQTSQAVYLEGAEAEAAAILDEARKFEASGLALKSDRLAAEANLLARQVARRENLRASELSFADLLSHMGIAPTAKIHLEPVPEFSTPVGELADWLVIALKNRKELFIADAKFDISDENRKAAVAAFLPNLMGFGGFSNSSDSYLKYTNVWSLGVSGVMTVFDGFRNVAEYKAAKLQQEEAFLKREQQCMAIVLEVIRAHKALNSVQDSERVSAAVELAARERFKEGLQKAERGLLRSSELLTLQAAHQSALAGLSTASFYKQVTIASVYNVLGISQSDMPETIGDEDPLKTTGL